MSLRNLSYLIQAGFVGFIAILYIPMIGKPETCTGFVDWWEPFAILFFMAPVFVAGVLFGSDMVKNEK